MQEAPDEATIRSVVINNADVLVDAGFSKPLMKLTLVDKKELMEVLLLHYTIFKSKAELDDMKKGLQSLGVGDMIRLYPDLLQSFFLATGVEPLTSGKN